MELTKESIEEALKNIEGEIKSGSYKLPNNLLRKVDTSTELGKANLSYIKGAGGYYYQLLPLLVRYLKPKNVLELGSFYGISTLMMYSELDASAKLTSLDIEKDLRYVPEEIFKDSRVKFVWGDDLNLNIFKNNIPNDIDLIYIDTVHFDQQVRDEYSIYKNFLAQKALIIMDDIHLGDTGKLFEELPFIKWDVTKFYHHSGFGIILFERPEDFPQDSKEAILKAALASAAIGHRKYNMLQKILDSRTKQKFYAKVKSRIANHPKLGASARIVLKPIKKFIIPKDIKY